jgi:hypothetical protein
MATAYTSLLGLALPVTGELSGTWGDTVNNSITSLLDTAVAGTTTISADADITLTTTTGASNQSRQAIILWTAGGTTLRTITAPAQSKVYIVINKTSSTQSIKLVGVGPTTGVTIVAGEYAVCAWNGVDFVKVSNLNGAGTFTSITATADSTFSSTGALQISKGTTGQQPGSPATGMIRYNTTTNQFEGYSGSSPAWKSIGGSALSNDTSTASSLYPVFAGATTGTAENLYTSNAKLLYKPSTGEFQASVPVASNGIFVNNATVAASYSIASGYNGHSVGPMTIASGQSVTVASGQRWIIL